MDDTTPTTAPRTSTARADKSELVDQAMSLGVPSYEAWAMTVPALTKMLEA
ncbi:hypothetical protein [Blastococcus sp. TF02A-26]|uniref:hypothetical protein n=1 Tax=Blastococcus sp. TF02A-26 TaxID=2250577 RepID=UPI001314BA26|nr:hypothetical protein [Blastococcus sp. TF02A-26]